MTTTQEKAFQVIQYDNLGCIGTSWCVAYIKAENATQAKKHYSKKTLENVESLPSIPHPTRLVLL